MIHRQPARFWDRECNRGFLASKSADQDLAISYELPTAASPRRIGRFTSKWRRQCACRMLADFPEVICQRPVSRQRQEALKDSGEYLVSPKAISAKPGR